MFKNIETLLRQLAEELKVTEQDVNIQVIFLPNKEVQIIEHGKLPVNYDYSDCSPKATISAEEQLSLPEAETRPAPMFPPGFYKDKPRPSLFAEEVLMAAANKLMPHVMQWGEFPEDEADEIAKQVLEALKRERDGYKLAKYLDSRFSWDSDSELAEIMEGADFYGAHRNAVIAWMADNAITPVFEVGKQVTVKILGGQDHIGTIRSLTEDGMYCVRIPAKGHVENGLGVQGQLFPWEDVETWNAATEKI